MKVSEQSKQATTVKIVDARKNFGKLQALGGISLEIGGGEFFTLLGPSGCGKTTLLRSVSGFEKLTSGHIFFNGEDTTALPPWEKNIGFVFQNYALWPNKSIFNNISYGLEIRNYDASAIHEKVKWALDLVELPGIEHKYPEELSGGQQQRVAIARALVIDPRLLLLDEPLSNLDAKLRIILRQQIKSIQQKLGVTAIYVTHDQEEALEISDRIAVIRSGCIQQIGTPKEIYQEPANSFVADFIGKANLLPGTLRGGKSFVLADGFLIPLPSVSKESAGTILFMRPEDISLVAVSEPESFCGLVTKCYFLGNIYRYQITLGNSGTFVLVEIHEELHLNEKVYLKVRKYGLFNE
ncbi:MAG: ABC transporter ATP-binding protein [Spirochaetia bacterium]|nr:ABC transporter ATP-binding protein [Spirochaetia bacterium]